MCHVGQSHLLRPRVLTFLPKLCRLRENVTDFLINIYSKESRKYDLCLKYSEDSRITLKTESRARRWQAYEVTWVVTYLDCQTWGGTFWAMDVIIYFIFISIS